MPSYQSSIAFYAHLYGIPDMFATYSILRLYNDDLPYISLDLGTIHISLGCPN